MEKKGFRFRTLMLRYFRIMAFSLGVPVMVSTMAVLILLIRGAQSDFQAETNAMLEKAADYMDGIWTQTQKNGTQAAYDQSVTDFFRLNRRERFSIQMRDRLNDIFGYLRAMNGTILEVDSVLVAAFSPDYYITTHGAWSRPDYYVEILGEPYPYQLLDELRVSGTADAWCLFKDDISHYRAIMLRNAQVGCIFQRCDSAKIAETVNGIFQNTDRRMLMVDETGLVMHDSMRRSTGESLSALFPTLPISLSGPFEGDGMAYRADSRASHLRGMHYVLLSETRGLSRYISRTVCIGAGVILLVLFICMLVAYRFAQVICKPYMVILDLLRTPVQDARENYERRYAMHDELGMIYTLIHQTKYQNMTMQNELTEREQALRDAQNIALQAQMNPHFMFNALEAINWKVFEKLPSDREITGMIQDLSLLLRISLETSGPLIAVEQEIMHATVYLRIQKSRVNDPFETVWDIDSELYGMTMPRLSLQPLFENAISHGIKKLDGGGKIHITGRIEGSAMIFSVSDNGPGFDPTTLARIRKNLVDSRWKRSSSIGLVNVNTRIQLLFGVEYGVSIDSIPYERTEARITIPITRDGGIHWREL